MINEILQENLKMRKFYLSQLEEWAWKPLVKVIVWARRVWKSSLLEQLIQKVIGEKRYLEDEIFYMNKEFPEYDGVKNYEDLTKMILDFLENKEKAMIVIDEIQEIQNWEKTINGILSKYREKVDIYITGSNAHLLSWEYATYLTWRYVTISVFPLTFDEYCAFYDKPSSQTTFLEFLEKWGLPGLSLLWDSKNSIFQYLSAVYTTIVEKDIESRFKINKKDFFQNLYKYLFLNVGNVFSAKKITDYLKNEKITISVDTVLDYLSYGEDAFLLHKLHSQDVSTKKLFSIYNKYYVGDVGMRNALTGFVYQRDLGALLENYVFLVLKKYGFSVMIGRDKEGREIDFIAEKYGNRIYLQVSQTLLQPSTLEREYASLLALKDQWPKMIVTMDQPWSSFQWILQVNILDFEHVIQNYA